MILFPHTDLFSNRQFPLFLLAPQLDILRGWQSEQSTMADCFTKAGFCQAEHPHPFADGEEEQRFSRLITDIATRKDEYTTQLEALMLAAMTEHKDNDERSERSIIRAITGEESGKEINEKVWQARLILALGELVDREQEEIDAHLVQLDETTQALFTELHGENQEHIEANERAALSIFHGENRKKIEHGRIEHIPLRVAAWRTLFKKWYRKNGTQILLTKSREAADFFTYPITIPVPAQLADTAEKACEILTIFHRENKGIVALYQEWLSATIKQQEKNAISPSFQEWENTLNRRFPLEQYGRDYIYAGTI